MKPIRFSAHALGYVAKRGFSLEEVEEAIRLKHWAPAELNHLECRMEFSYNQFWNGNFYHIKQVRPIFIEDPDEIVVITVYTYFY